MIIALQLAFFTLAFSNSLENYQEYIRESNEIINFFVNVTGKSVDCGDNISNPCRQIYYVFYQVIMNNQYNIHVFEGQYDYDLSYHEYFINAKYPSVDIIAEQNVSINVIGTIQPIGKIIISFTNFSIDFGDLFFQIDDDGSSLKFSSCNLFRNASKTAINSHSLVIVDRGSLILEKMNITGNSLEGNEALIQSSQPLLIQFTSLNITNISLMSENVEPLLLSVAEHDQNSQIIVQDVHIKQNTAGNKAEAGIIYIHSKNLKINSIKNEINAANPILIENSEIIQNMLAPIQESCAIQIEGLRASEIRITNSTFDNRSPPNNDRQYEFKIVLPSGMNPDDLKSKFRDIQLGIVSFPVAVKVFPSTQYTDLLVPLSSEYTYIHVNSNGRESCTSYIANFHDDVSTLSCAMIIIRAQEQFGLTNKAERVIYIYGSFTENDLRTDDLTISFRGSNIQTPSENISFKPNLPISTNPIDHALFRIRDGGLVTLTDLYIQRSNITGSENAPIIMIISGAVQQSNGQQKNAAGQIVINKCILEGGNSASSDAWYNQGLAETCNVGYYAAIVADGQTTVQISGSTIRTFEGPAVRALNGASVTIDKNTTLDNNGQRNRNTLSSMQTNVVCEGGIGTTSVDIALDNVTSFTSTGNAWIFSPSGNKCTINATFNGEVALPRSLPQTNSANVTINTTNQQAEVTINGKFLEPCIRTLLLELCEATKAGLGEVLSFDIESKSIQANWINSENIKFTFSSSLLEDLNTSVQWRVSIYESGKRMTAKWVLTYPVIDGIGQDEPGDDQPGTEQQPEKAKQTISGGGIAAIVIVMAVLITASIIFIALYLNFIYQKKKKTNEANDSNISVHTFDQIYADGNTEHDKAFNQKKNNSGKKKDKKKKKDNNNEIDEQTFHNKQRQRIVHEADSQFITDSDIEQIISSDNNISGDHLTKENHLSESLNQIEQNQKKKIKFLNQQGNPSKNQVKNNISINQFNNNLKYLHKQQQLIIKTAINQFDDNKTINSFDHKRIVRNDIKEKSKKEKCNKDNDNEYKINYQHKINKHKIKQDNQKNISQEQRKNNNSKLRRQLKQKIINEEEDENDSESSSSSSYSSSSSSSSQLSQDLQSYKPDQIIRFYPEIKNELQISSPQQSYLSEISRTTYESSHRGQSLNDELRSERSSINSSICSNDSDFCQNSNSNEIERQINYDTENKNSKLTENFLMKLDKKYSSFLYPEDKSENDNNSQQ